MRNLLPLFWGKCRRSRTPTLLPSRSPPNGIWGFHLGAHGVLSFTTRNVHYDFGELVQIARSLCHVPNINLRKPGCKAVQIQTEHYTRFDSTILLNTINSATQRSVMLPPRAMECCH